MLGLREADGTRVGGVTRRGQRLVLLLRADGQLRGASGEAQREGAVAVGHREALARGHEPGGGALPLEHLDGAREQARRWHDDARHQLPASVGDHVALDPEVFPAALDGAFPLDRDGGPEGFVVAVADARRKVGVIGAHELPAVSGALAGAVSGVPQHVGEKPKPVACHAQASCLLGAGETTRQLGRGQQVYVAVQRLIEDLFEAPQPWHR